MFKKLEWDKKYEIGVKEIDLQHHYFIELINRIAEELKQPIPEKYKNRLLDELYKYAAFHFISEENLMLKHNFPGFDQHFQLHRELVNKLSHHAYLDTADEFLGFLTGWFLNHTLKEDKEIARHILNRPNTSMQG